MSTDGNLLLDIGNVELSTYQLDDKIIEIILSDIRIPLVAKKDLPGRYFCYHKVDKNEVEDFYFENLKEFDELDVSDYHRCTTSLLELIRFMNSSKGEFLKSGYGLLHFNFENIIIDTNRPITSGQTLYNIAQDIIRFFYKTRFCGTILEAPYVENFKEYNKQAMKNWYLLGRFETGYEFGSVIISRDDEKSGDNYRFQSETTIELEWSQLLKKSDSNVRLIQINNFFQASLLLSSYHHFLIDNLVSNKNFIRGVIREENYSIFLLNYLVISFLFLCLCSFTLPFHFLVNIIITSFTLVALWLLIKKFH